MADHWHEAKWIRAYKRGDREAGQQLALSYSSRAEYMARRLTHTNREDLAQEALLLVLYAATRYKPERGAAFSSFVRQVWRARLPRINASYMHGVAIPDGVLTALHKGAPTEKASLSRMEAARIILGASEVQGDHAGDCPDPEAELDQRRRVARLRQELTMLRARDPRAAEICEYALSGGQYSDLAPRYGVSRQRLHQILAANTEKLRELLCA